MELSRSRNVFAMLADPSFQIFWDELHTECPWKTAFQSRSFVTAWYEHYNSSMEPVLLFSRDPENPVLLPLAAGSRRLVIAGAHQAEYHAWLARQASPQFLPDAMRLLRKHFDFDELSFKYLPPGFPLEVLPHNIAEVERVRRPLMRVNPPDDLLSSLKKKANKSKLSGLKKHGELILEHITDTRRLEEFLGEVITMYDFRQGAMNDSIPFEEDPQKRGFYVALAGISGLTHCSVLRVGSKPVAAHLGVFSGDKLHLGVFAYSPLYGQYSPGKFHLMLLGMKLQEEGFAFIDLTPGGDEWKGRFASEYDDVHCATIHTSSSVLRRRVLANTGLRVAKQVALKVNLTPADVRAVLRRVRQIRFGKLIRKSKPWFSQRVEFRIYRIPVSDVRKLPQRRLADRDNLSHLLGFRPLESWDTRDGFLSTALRRLESAQHVYTRYEDQQLVHYGWLIERQDKSFFTEVSQEFEYPPNSAVLFDFYTHPGYRGRGYYYASLLQMLHDAAEIPGTEYIYISVLADNTPSRHVIEKAGFCYQGSLFHTRHLGHSTKWSLMPPRAEKVVGI